MSTSPSKSLSTKSNVPVELEVNETHIEDVFNFKTFVPEDCAVNVADEPSSEYFLTTISLGGLLGSIILVDSTAFIVKKVDSLFINTF